MGDTYEDKSSKCAVCGKVYRELVSQEGQIKLCYECCRLASSGTNPCILWGENTARKDWRSIRKKEPLNFTRARQVYRLIRIEIKCMEQGRLIKDEINDRSKR